MSRPVTCSTWPAVLRDYRTNARRVCHGYKESLFWSEKEPWGLQGYAREDNHGSPWKRRHNICMAAKRQGFMLRFTEGSQEGFEEGQGARSSWDKTADNLTGRDKLIVLADAVQDEVEERSRTHWPGKQGFVQQRNRTEHGSNVARNKQSRYSGQGAEVLDEATEAAGKSCAHLADLWTRLEFLSMDSEAGSFMGNRKTERGYAWEDQAKKNVKLKW